MTALRLDLREEGARLARYAVVGVTNTLLTLAVFALLTAVGLPAPVASAAGFAAGAANGYGLNRRWTFRVHARGRGTAARYVVVQACGAALSAIGVVLAGAAGFGHLEAELLVLPVVTLLTYAAARTVVFRA
jgi:putative flippase GtrA